MSIDVVVIGGFGHVGLPLAIVLADRGKKVCALDIDKQKTTLIEQGRMPFIEEGAEEILRRVLPTNRLKLSCDPSVISEADTIIVTIGTPVDEHLNPEFEGMYRMIDSYLEFFRDGQLIIIRSTVYPGTTEKLKHLFLERGKNLELAFCPERIAEGAAIKELQTLPQIISSFSEDGLKRCRQLFSLLTKDILVLEPVEAELTKLFNNVWRYVEFATANQFFTIANDHGADFYRIHHAMTYKYDRAKNLPRPGFAAGPCLFKDAMQLAAFNNNTFYMGHAAMLTNEGLPNYIISRLKQKYHLDEMTVGVLGMAFKGNIDDRRESLSYKLKKILAIESHKVLCSDVYIKEPGFVSTDELIKQAQIIILATPHREYADLKFSDEKVVVDVWNMWGKGCVI
ncbi:MAG: nucleotide sugar dehydrogenase [Chloroflexota bacterium]